MLCLNRRSLTVKAVVVSGAEEQKSAYGGDYKREKSTKPEECLRLKLSCGIKKEKGLEAVVEENVSAPDEAGMDDAEA